VRGAVRIAEGLGSRPLCSSLLLPIVVAAVAYLVIGYSAGTRYGDSGDPAAFISPGQRFLAPELLPPGTPVSETNGSM
jgi:hypothetical protein